MVQYIKSIRVRIKQGGMDEFQNEKTTTTFQPKRVRQNIQTESINEKRFSEKKFIMGTKRLTNPLPNMIFVVDLAWKYMRKTYSI